MRPTDRWCGCLRHAEVLDLAGLDEFLDRTGDILDGHIRVDAVLVIEVDGVHAEPLQRAVDDLLDHLGPAGDPASRLALDGIDVPAELGRDHDLVLVRGERLAHELLVGVRTVDLGGVEEGHAAVHSGVDQRDHLLPVRLIAVAAGHAHAAQPDCRNLEAVGAQLAFIHNGNASDRAHPVGVPSSTPHAVALAIVRWLKLGQNPALVLRARARCPLAEAAEGSSGIG